MAGSLFNVGRYFKNDSAQNNDAEKSASEKTSASQQPPAANKQTTPPPSAPASSTPPPASDQKPDQSASTNQNASPSVTPPTPAPSDATQQGKDTSVTKKTTSSTTESKQTTVASGKAPSSPQEKEQKSPLEKRAGMDVLSRLTQRSNKSLVAGVNKAKEMKANMVDTEYVLWGLIQDSGIYQLISDLKVTPTEFVQEIEKTFKQGSATESPKFSPRVKKVLELSFPTARRLGYEFISPEHVLLGLAEEGEGLAAQLLSKKGITVDKLKKKIGMKKEGEEEEKQEKSAVSQYANDLTQMAQEGKLDPVIARSKEIERIMHILSRRTKNNPVLIGDAGVGKTAVVEGLAQRIVKGNVPEPLLNKRILALDLMGLLAGASKRGEFEKRFKALISEVKASQGQIILFIDELHNLVGTGGSGGAMDASNILKPSLARGEMQTIGTTTVTEYRTHIEKDRALERRFQPVLINEPNQEDAIEMIRGTKDKYEAFHKVSITDSAIRSAVRLSARYIGDRFLPDKAVDLIDEAASAVRLPAISLPEEIRGIEQELNRQQAELKDAESQNNTVKKQTVEKKVQTLKKDLEAKKQEYEVKKGTSTTEVAPEMVQQIVARWTGIPIARLTESESEKLVNLEDTIHKKLIDQEQAVSAVSEAVRRGRAGLSSSKRPIGSFIFMGPTGVGKTELAKVLADELFGSVDMMIRLDMTEYMEKHEVAKLIGAPPGYVGYEEGGQLTEAVRRKPYSVVLMDEIEKAHPDVFNILLQILDDGRLTDNKGRTISFKNTILICTSNIGTNLIQKTLVDQMEVGELQSSKEKENTIDTYVITPTGRMIVTRGKDYWQTDVPQGNQESGLVWVKKALADYFAGQKLKEYDALSQDQKFPTQKVDTHTVLPSGAEIITVKDRLWKRTSTTVKEWDTLTLIDYFKNQTVSNAEPDKPEQQLPTAHWETHAVNPQEKEIVSLGDRVWVRENQQETAWKTYTKQEYLKQKKQSLSEAAPENQQNSQPDGQNTPSPQPANNDANQPPVYRSDELSSAMGSDKDKNTQDASKKDAQEKEKTDKSEVPEEKKAETPPVKTWDAHVFTPQGDEIIVVEDMLWKRGTDGGWQKAELTRLLTGQGAPIISKPQEPSKSDKAFEDKFAMLSEKLLEELRKFFKPELLNRFDEVIVFRPLVAQHMLAIVDLQLESLRQRLEHQELGIEITDPVKEELTIVGFDPVYGARPLRRTIQRLVENPISTMLIKGDLKEGDTVVIDFDHDTNDFVFTTRRPAPAEKKPPESPPQPESPAPDGAEKKQAEKNEKETKEPGDKSNPEDSTTQAAAPEDTAKEEKETIDISKKTEPDQGTSSLSDAMSASDSAPAPQPKQPPTAPQTPATEKPSQTPPITLGNDGKPAGEASAPPQQAQTSGETTAAPPPVKPESPPTASSLKEATDQNNQLPSIKPFGASQNGASAPPSSPPPSSSNGLQMQKS